MSGDRPPLSNIEMVSCGLTHAPVLAALHADAFDVPWPESAFAELSVQQTVTGWLAKTSEPLGFILIRRARDEAEILTLAVTQAMRRRGVGAALVDHALDHIKQLGVRTCYLEVAVDNAAARAMYGKAGFAETGRRRDYYQRGKGRIDALIMGKALP